ncbi:MAG: family acetyltransferase [Frankiales bacterium]|nr:family acetyltransferase [Frankiales bacterium]
MPIQTCWSSTPGGEDRINGAAWLPFEAVQKRRYGVGRERAAATVPPMRINDLASDRADDAVALWHATGLTRPWNDPYADLMRALTGPTSTVLGAQDKEDRLLGTAMVGHDGHRGWVYYLAVQPDLRRTGIGRELMLVSEGWLRQRQVPKINLMVRATNTGVLAFYERLGYEDGDVAVLGKFLNA